MKKNFIICMILLQPVLVWSQSIAIVDFHKDDYNWWKLDLGKDSLASISWNKSLTYLQKKNKKPLKQITVAVLDTDFDLSHMMLKNIISINKSEFRNNNLDDDNNGYKDDYNGWNFLGLKSKDSALAYVLMEEARILKEIDTNSFKLFKRRNRLPYSYLDVKSSFDSTVASLKDKIKPYKVIEDNYSFVMDTLSKLIPEEITLTSLSKFDSPNDTILNYVNFAKYYYENDFPYPEFISYLKLKELSLNICLNLKYDNRVLLQDNPKNIKDRDYGNHTFGKNTALLTHGTTVAGVLAQAIVDSTNLKKKSISNNYPVAIIPLTFTGIGDFTDKDFYLAFEYAIDNGAEILNISQGKSFSINPKILRKALNLAKKNNILVIMSSGNQGVNLDENWRFPQSIPKLYNKEFSNLLIVGASSKKLNKNLVDPDSNYGEQSVDVFAPGVDILTILPSNKFTSKSGSSFATPIVTNLAALIWSYYPKLKASQIKTIIMDSGVGYDGLVKVPCGNEENTDCTYGFNEKLFSTLSKSGKIINAFNALTLAEKLNSE